MKTMKLTDRSMVLCIDDDAGEAVDVYTSSKLTEYDDFISLLAVATAVVANTSGKGLEDVIERVRHEAETEIAFLSGCSGNRDGTQLN